MHNNAMHPREKAGMATISFSLRSGFAVSSKKILWRS
jgi:hypothetical protein